ncbi:hypothetical protein L211DRAFT_683959 [Terfezia boudieri ATCC MYA-4762]|uniref:Uncharacterized protein n=1 Tax=Terfezia boudieri ATCC MYA-4762 TaxID=1051890 RepID=A0A3N4M0W2_9PEZI|nr:hypothetical protein L211DRAFT_683959 [Terfezia boudieri ATCC MYA-4762]
MRLLRLYVQDFLCLIFSILLYFEYLRSFRTSTYVYALLGSEDARLFPTQSGKGDGSGNANTCAPLTPPEYPN